MSILFPLKHSCTGPSFIYLRHFLKGFRDQPRWISSSFFLFPGQGAQYVGMCKSLLTEPQVMKLFEDAQKILGYDLLSLCLNGPAEDLKKTEKCQAAVVVASLAALCYHSKKKAAIEVLKEWPVAHHTSVKTAGLSVGELSALMFAQALSLEDGLKVVKVRAQAMQQACEQHPSGMVSIVGPAVFDLQSLFDAAKQWSLAKGTKEPVACLANYLFPGGWVLGGDKSSIEYILKYGKVKHGIRRTQLLTSNGAFHTELMKSAQEPLQQLLDSINVQMPKFTVYSGTSCQPFSSPSGIKRLLVQQLVEPVYWLDTIKNMFKNVTGTGSHIYEAGPGQQLRAMLYRIDKTLLRNYTHLET